MQFHTDHYANNRKKLQRLLSDSQLAIVTAHRQVELSRDVEQPFSQERNFHYLTGDVHSQQMLLLVSSSGPTLVGVQPSELDVDWNGVPTLEAVASRAGISEVIELEGLADQELALRVKDMDVLMIEPRVASTSAVVANPAHAQLAEIVKDFSPKSVGSLNLYMGEVRSVKSDEEIELIEKLAECTVNILEEMSLDLFGFSSEKMIANEIEYRIRQAGFDGHGYSPIVAADGNAATIHHRSSSSSLTQEGIVLIDVGAASGLYSADISRTINGPKGSGRQQDIIDRLTDVQQQIIKLVAPGVGFQELEMEAERLVGGLLKDIGILSGKLTSEKIRKYFGHGFGHSLGLDVHDPVDYQQPLKEGMIITVEPGLYLPSEKAGYRVEDDILVTASGSRTLGSKV